MSVRIAHVVRGLIVNHDDIFPVLVRSFGASGLLQLPGGIVEGVRSEMPVSEGHLMGELSREVREELGLDINITAWSRIHQPIASKVFKFGENGHRADVSSGDVQYIMHYYMARTDAPDFGYTAEEAHKFALMIKANYNILLGFTQLFEQMCDNGLEDESNSITISLDTGLIYVLKRHMIARDLKAKSVMGYPA